ncbi:unnamed protein product [Choristocarpus tenellus]
MEDSPWNGTGQDMMQGYAGHEVGDEEYSDGMGEPAEQKPRILLMGRSRSGKSSINRVVFDKTSPHETVFLPTTTSMEVNVVANNSFAQFEILDFPGDAALNSKYLIYKGERMTEVDLFSSCSALVLVIDAQAEPYTDALSRLANTVKRAHHVNKKMCVEVFIHKVDGDLFLYDEHKIECQREISTAITNELREVGLDVHIAYYLTSIYDHSIFEAFSKVVQKLIPQLPTLETLLNVLISHCQMEKAFLFDVVSRIYIATDSNPVDMQTYELCSDMIDVVIDVSCIYGVQGEEEGSEGLAYDSDSEGVIALDNGLVLYLREVNSYLALVCLLREDKFEKKGLTDYNINVFKKALSEIFMAPVKQQVCINPSFILPSRPVRLSSSRTTLSV